MTNPLFGQGIESRKSLRQFVPTKENWHKFNLYILENKNIGNDSKFAFPDYPELFAILLKRKQINTRQEKALLLKFLR